MIQPPNKIVKDQAMNENLSYIYQNAFGNPIALTAVPASADMKGNTWGILGTDLYVKAANGSLLKFAGVLIP